MIVAVYAGASYAQSDASAEGGGENPAGVSPSRDAGIDDAASPDEGRPADAMADAVPMEVANPEAGRPADAATLAPRMSAGLGGEPAFLRGTINEVDVGDLFVVVMGADLWLRVSDLERAGLRVEQGTRQEVGEDLMVSLRSLAPRIRYLLNEVNLSLAITADASLYAVSTLDMSAQRPRDIVYGSAPSLFVNYSASLGELQSPSDVSWSGFGEAGLSLGGQLLYSSADRTPDGPWARLLSNLTLDYRDYLIRVVAGDSAVSSDALGGGMVMGGLSVTRTFALDPYFVTLPTQQLSGTALAPSTAEVYVNGQLVRRVVLPPGPFTLSNLPVTSGRGDTRVIIRDALGGTRTLDNPYYLALGTLAKGLSDFSYNGGFVRRGYGHESWDYGEAAFLCRHRWGITDWLTAGAHAEGDRHFASGGPSLALRLPRGELGMSLAASRDGDQAGGAALLSYAYVGRRMNLQLGARLQSDRYTNLSLLAATDRQRMDFTAAVSVAAGLANVSMQSQSARWRDRGWNDRLALMINRAISNRVYGFVTVATTFQAAAQTEYDTFAGLSFSVGPRTTASASRSDRWNGTHTAVNHADIQRSLPVGPGLGYRLLAETGTGDIEEAMAQIQGAHGRIEADYRHDGLASSTNRGHAMLTGTGGVVVIGRDLFFTRPVQDSYALIRVPDVEGVRATLSNQMVGATDAKGNLLIPSLLPLYGNRVGINDKDIPLDYWIGATEATLAPPYRGGAILSFPVRRVRSAAGTIIVDEHGTSTVPAYGQLVVQEGDGRDVISPLDELGNFYLENLGPGAHKAEVQHAAGACAFVLAVPEAHSAVVNLGTVRCTVERKESR